VRVSGRILIAGKGGDTRGSDCCRRPCFRCSIVPSDRAVGQRVAVLPDSNLWFTRALSTTTSWFRRLTSTSGSARTTCHGTTETPPTGSSSPPRLQHFEQSLRHLAQPTARTTQHLEQSLRHPGSRRDSVVDAPSTVGRHPRTYGCAKSLVGTVPHA